ncbi:hypothetical protein GCM10007973_26200 [Polymorphobacter multimanifer]|uniref:hypothetical protein n=1 Tax=Polymorphobacter multimanifer TaxID=1070431 RepID=UPI00166BC38E|nr:hypothetical protein [Polymorphobacter multimanifer]GGI88605.1 hypothetical protein GCM10007973_26200 [Polymorphobacter multimanifer]
MAFSSSNYSDTGERRIAFAFTNNGLGPALLGPVEVRYDRRIVRSPQELLAACCGFDNNRSAQLRTRPIANVALRPGQAVEFLSLPDVPANVPMVDELDAVRPRIHVRACYCSIFSECWTVAGEQAKPMAVAACPTNWLSYSER